MKESDSIPKALERIAKLLQEEEFSSQASAITSLREAALSTDPDKQQFFRKEITGNKYYWLGMGTIADICFQNEERDQLFNVAYYDLAVACEKSDLGSIYSKDVADVFGKWINRNSPTSG